MSFIVFRLVDKKVVVGLSVEFKLVTENVALSVNEITASSLSASSLCFTTSVRRRIMRCMGIRAWEKGFVLPNWSPVFLCFFIPGWLLGFGRGLAVCFDRRLYLSMIIVCSWLSGVGCR